MKQFLLFIDCLSLGDYHIPSTGTCPVATSLFTALHHLALVENLQCQLVKFMTIEHFHHMGFLSIHNFHRVPCDILCDSNSLACTR